MAAQTQRAVLAGGCFWGMQDLIRKLPGVTGTRVGYTGGDVPNATYRNHGTHAEAIEILFDPEKTDFRTLLEFFFQIHDPSTKNRQGNDIGLSYRSDLLRGRRAEADRRGHHRGCGRLRTVAGQGRHRGRAGRPFWEAEPEHQDYLERYPDGTPATSRGRDGGCPPARSAERG
ncbi:peptide-methionine (S)-S-oxide reductase MsrA [Streptomyces sp. T1317-0309]|nr:peptide-methionine (S)-S-oxide reductase MsrA [Streptomyces sp. T1317-0309]